MPPALHKYRQSCKREAEEGEETVVVRGGVQRRERRSRERYGRTKERRTKGNKPTVAEETGKEDLILRRKGEKIEQRGRMKEVN